jgi:Tfp pilus assembly protein FimT
MLRTGNNRTKSGKAIDVPPNPLQRATAGRDVLIMPLGKLPWCFYAQAWRARRARPILGCGHAFTLIELILVMAMLMIVLAVAFPSLKGFFRGRDLDSEARRFLSLTRYGQSRAISEGVPMVLWIDAQEKLYGLETQAGYTDTDSKAVEFALGDELQVEVQAPVAATRASLAQPVVRGLGNLPTICFQPDGFISDTSPESIMFRQTPDESIRITQSANRLNYEIRANDSPNAPR